MTYWLAWFALLTALFGLAAAALDRGAACAGAPRRLVWLGALAASTIISGAIGLRRVVVVDSTARATPIASEHSAGDGVDAGSLAPAVGLAQTAIGWQRVVDAVSSSTSFTDRWLPRVWIAVSLVWLAMLLRAVRRLRDRRRAWSELATDVGRVLVAENAGPAVVGFIRPRIVIPRWSLDADRQTLDLMLRHEREHLRAGDSRILFITAGLLAVFPWNAALFWIARRLRLAIEIDCDARVIRHIQDIRLAGGAHAYGLMLLAVGERYAAPLPASAFLSEPGSHLEARIEAMTTPRHRRPLVAAAPFAAIALAVLVTAAWTPRPAPFRVVHPASLPALHPVPLRGNPAPRYPDSLRSAGVEGHVFAKFTTDDRGIPDSASIVIIESTDSAFTDAVRRVIPAWKFDSGGSARMVFRFFLSDGPAGTGERAASPPLIDGLPTLNPVIITAAGTARPAPPRDSTGNRQDTPARRAFMGWLTAYNADSTSFDDYWDAHMQARGGAKGKASMHEMRHQTGEFELLSIRRAETYSLEFVVRSRGNDERRVGYISVNPASPGTVSSFRMLLVQPWRSVDDPALIDHLQKMRP